MENLDKLVRELIALPTETQWVEFKHDNYDPKMIGQDISALANGAALQDKDFAYFVWGIHNDTHEIVGTSYNLQNLKKGNQELENWLRYLLSAHADFEYQSVQMEGKDVGVLTIKAAENLPVTFEKTEYIRVGSYTKQLKEFPSIQARLWNKLQNKKFEEQIAKQGLTLDEVLAMLRYEVYFDLLGIPRPNSPEAIVHYLLEDDIVIRQDDGLYGISNLGAILFSKDMSAFPRISRKALRVVQYAGKNRLERIRENPPQKGGYAVVFEDMIRYIGALTPAKETIDEESGLRKEYTAYPSKAIREVVANALIHQDFTISGTGPTVEIFSNRIEVTNPGRSIVDVFRLIDSPPRSRNEKLSSLMRRMGICEELGTGWDKIVSACELQQLPAPRMDVYEESTRTLLFSDVKYSALSIEDKLWACYLHASVLYVQGEMMSNRSLRERFGLPQTSAGSISRLIKEAMEKQLIKPYDTEASNKYMRYIPIWA